MNLSLSCYPDRLEYVDQILSFAKAKVSEYTDSPDLHHPVTIQNLLALLLAPVASYVTALTLLALPSYLELLLVQPFATRRSIGNAVVAAVLRNEVLIENPEDVKGILDLCHVLVRDQTDKTTISTTSTLGSGLRSPNVGAASRGQQNYDMEEMAEEQGWIARMVHLFRVEDLEIQFKVSEFSSLPRLELIESLTSYCKLLERSSQKVVIEFDGLFHL